MSAAILLHWQNTIDRLHAGEPLRLLIGEKLYNSSELVLTASFVASLRNDIIAEIETRIGELTPPPDPDAQDATQPVEGGKGDCPSGTFARQSAASREAAISEGQS